MTSPAFLPPGLTRTLFESSHPSLFLDYFRVPHRVAAPDTAKAEDLSPPHPFGALGQLRRSNDSTAPALYWPTWAGGGPSAGRAGSTGEYRLGSTPIFCRVVPDGVAQDWLSGTGRPWIPSTTIRDAKGACVASVRRDDRGSIFLPFDPSEAIRSCWSEAYATNETLSPGGRLKRLAMRGYYRARPALPRPVQIRLRQLYSHVQRRARFPHWPVETALHDLYALLFRLLAEIAHESVPWIAPWPKPYDWALVLTHDVETEVGYRHLNVLGDVEVRRGYRSSWNFVPRRYEVDDAVIARLSHDGFEVGIHGLYHDGRDLESLSLIGERLPAMRQYAERWRATGFRSPATHRVWEWMPLLGFDYDSSYPDTDPFEPQAGGCCTWLPYFNRDLVELPITLTQDHTLFAILRQADEAAWIEKASFLKAQGGMALLITHPDYMLSRRRVAAYARLLDVFRDDATAWRALPREVSAWWRRRAASSVELTPHGWRIVGPAAVDGTIRLASEY